MTIVRQTLVYQGPGGPFEGVKDLQVGHIHVTAHGGAGVLHVVAHRVEGTFDLDTFAHVAVWNAAHQRVEMHLESRADQHVRIGALDRTIHFTRGERIWTESSITTLLVTHDVAEAVFLADRVLVMTGRPGRLKLAVDVTFERPRASGCTRDPAFHDLVDELTSALEAEADPSEEPEMLEVDD